MPNFYKISFSVLLFFITACASVPSNADRTTEIESSDLPVHKVITKIEILSPDTSVRQGEFFFVRVKAPRKYAKVYGKFQSNKIEFFPEQSDEIDGNQFAAMVGVSSWTKPGDAKLEMRICSNQTSYCDNHSFHILVEDGKFPSEVLRVPPRTVEPTAKDLKRIKRERKILKKVYSASDEIKRWDAPVVMPVENVVTSVFGSRRVYNGKITSSHSGTDLRAPTGTPILAPLSGKVVLARRLFYTGNTVILDHGYGFFTVYAHMSKLKIKNGVVATKGQLLGLSGATGRVNGPHLHWGVRLHGTRIDPFALVRKLK